MTQHAIAYFAAAASPRVGLSSMNTTPITVEKITAEKDLGPMISSLLAPLAADIAPAIMWAIKHAIIPFANHSSPNGA